MGGKALGVALEEKRRRTPMIKLLIIADDFTGALDTGIQFVKKGIQTQVIIGTGLNQLLLSESAEVLVVDSETRPMSGQKARDVVERIVRQAMELGVETIYKKTDSALRGNVGAELAGVLRAAGGSRLYFLPAFPEVKRVTEKGIHYINGVKLEDSEFGRDPFDPMTCSYVPDILRKQTDLRIALVEREQELPPWSGEQELVVFDALEDRDIQRRITELKNQGELRLLAGCAGFAAFLAEALELKGDYRKGILRTGHFVVACGSLNPITREQVEYAQSSGFYRKNLLPAQKLCPDYYSTPEGKEFLRGLTELCGQEACVELDTFDLEGQESVSEYVEKHGIDSETVRFAISACYGKIVRHLVEQELDLTVLMTGGDTLMGFMKEIGVNQISPVAEVGQGTVLSRLYWNGNVLQVISKSGGYGEKDVFEKAARRILEA